VPDGLEFDWDEGNRQHIARHGVTPAETEQVIENDPLDLGAETVDGEERFLSLGLTSGGRLLMVVTTMRDRKVRVITAYEAGRKLAMLFVQQKGL
jgi:uncharacterized DUF497 family protein